MYSKYDSLNQEEQEKAHELFQKAWTQRVLDFGGEQNREILHNYICSQRKGRGYIVETLNAAWEGFFINHFEHYRNRKSIHEVLKNFTTLDELKALSEASHKAYMTIVDGPKKPYWSVKTDFKMAMFKTAPEAFQFLQAFLEKFKEEYNQEFTQYISVSQISDTEKAYEDFISQNQNNDVDFAVRSV